MKSKISRIKMVLPMTLTVLMFSMMLVPAGFAEVGVGKDDWVKYSEFNGIDEWPVSVTEYLYVNNVSLTRNEWTRAGKRPYLGTIDYSANYTKATADSQEIGDFEFQNFTDGTISEVYIELCCRQAANEKIKVWYSTDGGSNWIDSGTLTPAGYWDWFNTGDESANIDTWAKVNSLLVYLESVADGTWDGDVEVDCMRLRIEKPEVLYVPPNMWNLTWSMPDYWPKYNTEWIDTTVQDVSGTEVSLLLTTHFENGSEEDKTLNGDVATGAGNLGFFVIEANLEEGDQILWDHTEVTGAGTTIIKLYVNGTVSREYAGVSREVNYVTITIPPSVAMATYANLTAYWDKATGVLCEISIAVTFGPIRITRGYIDAWTSFKLTETNVFAPPPIWTEWWFWTIIAVIVVVAAGSGILIRRRGKGT